MDREDKIKMILAVIIVACFVFGMAFLYGFLSSIADNISANAPIVPSGSNVAIVIHHAGFN